MVRRFRRYRRPFFVLVRTVAAMLATAGSGGDDAPTTEGRTGGGGGCPQDDDAAMSAHSSVFAQPVPGRNDIRESSFDRYLQLADSDKAVSKFVEKLAGCERNPTLDSLTAVYFDTTFQFAFPAFFPTEVDYLDGGSAVISFAVGVDTAASQTPQVRAAAEVAGRLVCSQGIWQVALADVCAILADGASPPCPAKVTKKARGELPRALKKADLPEVSPPTVETVSTTTSPPTTTPPPPPPETPDGVCPYVGQPCSANVTNDPDCTCVPAGVSAGFSKVFGVIACAAPEPAFLPDQ